MTGRLGHKSEDPLWRRLRGGKGNGMRQLLLVIALMAPGLAWSLPNVMMQEGVVVTDEGLP